MKNRFCVINSKNVSISGRIICFLMVIGLGFSQTTVAQENISTSEVREKAQKALSIDKLLAKRNINYTLTTQQGNISREVKVVAKEANKAAIHMSEANILVSHNGSYFMRTDSGVIDITDVQLIQQIDNYTLPIRAMSLVNWSKARATSKDQTEVTISEGDDKEEVKLWFDKKNLLPKKIVKWQEWKGETYLVTVLIEEYTKVQGISIPSKLKTIHETSEGVFESTQLVTDISFDKTLDQDLFKAVKKK